MNKVLAIKDYEGLCWNCLQTRRWNTPFVDKIDQPLRSAYAVFGPVAQLGAHYIRIVGVGSSNLLRSTKKRHHPSGGVSFWHGEIRKSKCNSSVFTKDTLP